MLSLFPTLLTYELIAPFLIRVTLGIVLILWAFKNLRGKSNPQTVVLGITDGIVGILLIIGLFTQLATLVAAVVLGAKLVSKAMSKALFTNGVNYYFVLFILALTLLVTGAGFFAFDMPL